MEKYKMESNIREIRTAEDLNEDERKIVNECISIKKRLMEISKEGSDNSTPNFFERHDFIVNFAQELMKKYPDYIKCFLFHILIGSSYQETENGYFDFPGEYSIYKNLLKWEGDKKFFYESIRKNQQEENK